MSKRVLLAVVAVCAALPLGAAQAGSKEEAGVVGQTNTEKQFAHSLQALSISDGYPNINGKDAHFWQYDYKVAMHRAEQKQYAGQVGEEVETYSSSEDSSKYQG